MQRVPFKLNLACMHMQEEAPARGMAQSVMLPQNAADMQKFIHMSGEVLIWPAELRVHC